MENESTTATTRAKHQTIGANGNLMTDMNYAENQWSPLNQTGKKYYNREQLFKINNKSICKTRPKYLQETNVTLKEARMTMFKPTICENLVRNEAGISNRIVIKLLPNFARTSNTPQQQTQHNQQQQQNTFTKRNKNNNYDNTTNSCNDNNSNNNNSFDGNNIDNNNNINDNVNSCSTSHSKNIINNDNNSSNNNKINNNNINNNNIDNNNNLTSHCNNYLPDKKQDVTKQSVKHLINVSLSLNEDIKLSKTHNAWKSSYLKKKDEQTKDQYITQELYKSVRSILNKLTPEKLEALLKQMNELSIDTPERLNGVINLIFEKATDEPKFSFSYALLCNSLLNIEFPVYDTCFRKSLINKCRTEFLKYTNFTSNEYSNGSTNSVDNEEEDKAKIRRRMVGTVCFIGELYKIQIMTSRVMLTCIKILLISKDEDCLEYLCKLLTTIGGNIDESEKLTSYFNQMLDIVNKNNKLWAHIKISSRIRFMLLNVLELRNNGWTPRQPVMNPKKMEQIQQEAETERLNIELRNATPVPEKRDSCNCNNNDSSNRNHQSNEDNQSKTISVDTNKFRTNFTIDDNTTLGSQSMFRWNKTRKNESTDTSNRYEILSEIDNTATESNLYHKKDQRSSSNRDKHINRRGRSLQPSLERISKHSYSKGSTLHTNYNNVK